MLTEQLVDFELHAAKVVQVCFHGAYIKTGKRARGQGCCGCDLYPVAGR